MERERHLNSKFDQLLTFLKLTENDKILETIVQKMKEMSPERLETGQQARRRMNQVKSRLRSFISTQKISENNIIIVAHSNFLKHFTSTYLNPETGKPEGHHTFLNSEYIQYELEL